MCEQRELQDAIAVLEARRGRLMAIEESLNTDFCRCTTDAQARAIERQLDDLLDDLDKLSDRIGTLQQRLDDLEKPL